MPESCHVLSCDYVVEAHLDDFLVCALHDARQTRQILELLEVPCSGWSCGKPIVYRAGIALSAEHFEPRESRSSMKAFDDPKILEVDPSPSRVVHPNQDLTAE